MNVCMCYIVCVCVCVCVCAMASCYHWFDNHSGPVVSGFLNTAACGVFSIPLIGYVGLVGGMGKGRVCTCKLVPWDCLLPVGIMWCSVWTEEVM